MKNSYVEVGYMPSLSIYVRKELYRKLIKECDKLQMGESEFINAVLEGYFNAQEKKNIPPGA